MQSLSWLIPALSLLTVLAGGGLCGAWWTHKRLAPKSKAEAREITAAAMDRDWTRFHREIDRLVKRLEMSETQTDKAERKADQAIAALHQCEERESLLKARVVVLEAYAQQESQMRQDAAMIVATERQADAAAREPGLRRDRP